MSVDEQIPDYDLDEMVVVTAPEQLRALADPLRTTLLELLLERAHLAFTPPGRPRLRIAIHYSLRANQENGEPRG